jgi:N-dimethylarginine dimethylaminohydrolase
LNDHQAIWCPSAFSSESQRQMKKQIELIEVPRNEAQNFACNAVVINNHVILPHNCFQTNEILQKLEFIVHPLNMSEFLKSGGACKCLTLCIA